jgi:diguanylate cyclase (GGDEF)-like protein
MDTDIRKLLKEIAAEELIELFAPCMDDYLYIIDLQKNTFKISEAAVNRFMMSGNSFDDAVNSFQYFVYKEDRSMIAEDLQCIIEGKEKDHNLYYRWLDKNGMPVWINCRGKVIDDKDGKPHYLIGCVNEIGDTQRADNVSGLLGERELRSYISSHVKDSSSEYLIHIGIDGFNDINGTLGVNYGNYVLKSVADCINSCLSDNQKLYHIVADEYMIIDLESHTKDDVMLLQKKICKKIEEFIISEKYKVVFTISTGIIYAKMLLKYYDEYRKIAVFSLKQAKSMGGNGVYFFEKEDYELFLRKEKIKSELRNAVANGFEGFDVYYQPIMDCDSGHMIGAEALMRFSMYQDKKIVPVSPVEFIPLLEETGLILPAGRYVIDKAVSMCHEMRQYIPEFKINVNISYIQMVKSDIWKDILSSIKQYDLPPECLCAELTESGYTDMTPYFYKLRKKFEEKNLQFVLDDFGTGYSNLHCIVNMKPNYVKLDKDFTAKAMSNARDFELLKKIVEMVHSVDIRICIEGIEKEEWYQKLKEIHVDYLQGYLFGKPCEKNQF